MDRLNKFVTIYIGGIPQGTFMVILRNTVKSTMQVDYLTLSVWLWHLLTNLFPFGAQEKYCTTVGRFTPVTNVLWQINQTIGASALVAFYHWRRLSSIKICEKMKSKKPVYLRSFSVVDGIWRCERMSPVLPGYTQTSVSDINLRIRRKSVWQDTYTHTQLTCGYSQSGFSPLCSCFRKQCIYNHQTASNLRHPPEPGVKTEIKD